MISTPITVGIDLQLARGLAYAAMTADGAVIHNGWLDPTEPAGIAAELSQRFPGAAVGIDAPRRPLDEPRQHYWDGANWRKKRHSDKGLGRHCEVVVSACGLARPQWTPLHSRAPEWMRWGFALFEALERLGIRTEEVFPSASYRMLEADSQARLTIPLSGFLPGPKDMLDAVVAAFTLREFIQGRGCEVGGGDGLGTIVLPRPLFGAKAADLAAWPGTEGGSS